MERKWTYLLLLLVSISYSNCTAFKSANLKNPLDMDGAFSGSSSNPSLMCTESIIEHSTLRKLSNSELSNSINDLLGTNINLLGQLPPDAASADGFTNNGDFLKTTIDYATQLMPILESTLAAAQAANSKAFACAATKDAACAQSLISSFTNRAYRKKLTTTELAPIINLFTTVKASGASFEESLSAAYESVLLSPNFLFRLAGQGSMAVDGILSLSSFEIVSRLSYFLWNSLPDDQLLDVANRNSIFTESVLRAEIDRMLKDPKAKRFTEMFVGQWLGIDKVLSPNLVSRTGITDQLRQDMVAESKAFFNYILLQNRSVEEVISGEYTFLNDRLAAHYGIPNVTGANLRLVDLKGTGRRGILTQGAFLTLVAKPTETNPIGRGNKILQLVTCNPPPPFDGGATVTELAPTSDPNLTIRERMEVHRANPKCASCHTEMDPIGLGLEGFDFLGRARTTYDTGRTIATAGVIRNIPFNNSSELFDILNTQPDYKRCISKNIMVYAIGRTATMNDSCVLQQIGNLAVQKDKTFTDLVMSIVMSQQFRFNSYN